MIVLASGRLLNLGGAPDHPSFEMLVFLYGPSAGAACLLRNLTRTKTCKNEVHFLPKQLDAKVATLHFPALGAKLSPI